MPKIIVPTEASAAGVIASRQSGNFLLNTLTWNVAGTWERNAEYTLPASVDLSHTIVRVCDVRSNSDQLVAYVKDADTIEIWNYHNANPSTRLYWETITYDERFVNQVIQGVNTGTWSTTSPPTGWAAFRDVTISTVVVANCQVEMPMMQGYFYNNDTTANRVWQSVEDTTTLRQHSSVAMTGDAPYPYCVVEFK